MYPTNLDELDELDMMEDVEEEQVVEPTTARTGGAKGELGDQKMEIEVSFENNVVVVPETVCLRVLLWNIQDLGGGPSQRGTKRADEVKNAIASLINRCKADFVGILELKKSGARPRKPKEPSGRQATRVNPFIAHLGADLHPDGFGPPLSNLVYRLVNALVWEPAQRRDDDFPEVDAEELEEEAAVDEDAEPPKTPKQRLDDELTKLDLARAQKLKRTEEKRLSMGPRKTLDPEAANAVRAELASESFGLLAKLLSLAEPAGKLAKCDLDDWSACDLDDEGKWPAVPHAAVKELRTRTRARGADGFAVKVKDAEKATRKPKQGEGNPRKDLDLYIASARAELDFLDNWLQSVRNLPAPKKEQVEEAKTHEQVVKLVQTVKRSRAALNVFALQWDFIRQVVKTILIPIVAAVKEIVGAEATERPTDDPLEWAKAFLGSSVKIRKQRYEEAKKRYDEQLKALQQSGSYPGLLEFLDIAKRVCDRAKRDSEGPRYEVWPPLQDLEALAEECKQNEKKDRSGEGGEASARAAQYFSRDEAYGILYNVDKLVGPGGEIVKGTKYWRQPYFLLNFVKRQPLVVPLRIRKLGIDVHMVVWHAPAPSSGNAEIRSKDFPELQTHANEFRRKNQLAIFLSDTNVDTREDVLNKSVEHWKGSPPTRRKWLTDLCADPTLLGAGSEESPMLIRPTSLVKSKIRELEKGRYAYHNAAYDKVLILGRKGTGGSTLAYRQQQIIAPARAILPPKEEPPEDLSGWEPPASPIEHPGSPLVSISRQASEGWAQWLFEPKSKKPEDQAKELVGASRRLSDHDGVLADFLVTGPTEPEPEPDFKPLVEELLEARNNGSDLGQALQKILESLGETGAEVDPALLGERLQPALGEEKDTGAPVEEGEASVLGLQEILAKLNAPSGKGLKEQPELEVEASKPSKSEDKPAVENSTDVIRELGLKVIRNAGGGVCLFYCVCDLRYGSPSTFSTAYGVRLKAVAHLSGILSGRTPSPPEMKGFLDELLKWHHAGFPNAAAYGDKTWKTYLAEMAKPYTWGDLIILSVMSHMFDQRYHLFVQAGPARWEDDVTFGGDEEHAQYLYCQNNFHWEAVVPGGSMDVEHGEAMRQDEREGTSAPTHAPVHAFPFDTSKRVVLWNTAQFWDSSKISGWGVTNWMFVFGDNHQRTGYGGQATIRGQPYARGLRTCKEPPSSSNTSTFHFVDTEKDQNQKWIEEDLATIEQDAPNFDKVVFPHNGSIFDLGTNLAQMKTNAPETFKWMQKRLKQFVEDLEKKLGSAGGSGLGGKPSGGSGGGEDKRDEKDEDDEDNKDSGNALKKRKVENGPSSQGCFKRGSGGEEGSAQVQLRSLYGASSESVGFFAEDVDIVPEKHEILPLTIRYFPPDIGSVELEKLDTERLHSRFNSDLAKVYEAIDEGVRRFEVQAIWGGKVSEDLGEDEYIREQLGYLLEPVVTKKRKVEPEEEEENDTQDEQGEPMDMMEARRAATRSSSDRG